MAVKLTYFNARGFGEAIRILLKYGEIEFEDIRVEQDDWPELRPTTPFAQLPVYEEDGQIAWQSIAICRYLGHKVKLAGETDWENLQIDAVVDTFRDLLNKVSILKHDMDDEHKIKLKEFLFAHVIPFYLGRLDKIAEENEGYLALKKLTWADVFIFAFSSSLFEEMPEAFAEYPNLVKVIENVQEVPQIKEWLESRPETEH